MASKATGQMRGVHLLSITIASLAAGLAGVAVDSALDSLWATLGAALAAAFVVLLLFAAGRRGSPRRG